MKTTIQAVPNVEQRYAIDMDKIQTLDDLKRIIVALNITFSRDCEGLDSIRDLVRVGNYSAGVMD